MSKGSGSSKANLPLAIFAGAVVLVIGAVAYVKQVPETPQAAVPAVQTLAAPTASETGTNAQPATGKSPDTTVAAQPETDTNTKATAETPQPDPQPAAPPAALVFDPPRFDVVRVDASGSALIAGIAPPLSNVAVEIDGTEITQVEAGGAGGFAALFDAPIRSEPQVVFLVAYLQDGTTMRSDESVIFAPAQQPVAKAPALAETPSDPQSVVDATLPNDPTPEPSPQDKVEETVALAQLPETSAPTDTDANPVPPADETLSVASSDATTDIAADTTLTAQVEPMPEAMVETTPEPTPETPDDPLAGLVAQTPATVAADLSQSVSSTAVTVAGASNPTEAQQAADSTTAVQSPAQIAAQTGDAASLAAAATASLTTAAPDQPAPASTVVASAIAAPAAPTVLLAGAQGVRVLQPSGAAADTRIAAVTVDAIGYDRDGSVTLSGRGTAPPASGGNLRVYLDNRPVIDGVIAADGSFAVDLPEIEAGIYTLRVDQLDPETGRVQSRFETPFQREDPDVLSRATPLTDGAEVAASVITVQPGFTLWGIASQTYGDGLSYVKVFQANQDQIKDPDLIYPGQVFDLPK